MKPTDPELYPLIDTCLIMQSIFLNFHWIVLLWGWLTSLKNHPEETLSGGRPGFYHWAVALTVWALVFGVSLWDMDPKYWFLGFAIANGALLSVLNPAFALSFSISMILMRPWEIMQGGDLMHELPRFSMFFSLAWSLFYFCVVDRFSFRLNKVVVLLLAYNVWVFLSTFVTPDPSASQAGFNETMMRALVLFMTIYHLARDQFSVWVLKNSIITIYTCVGMISIVFYFNHYTDGGRILAFGLFKNTNDIAAIMCLLLPLSLTPFVMKGGSVAAKAFGLLSIATSLTVLALAQSRGAIMALGSVIAVHFALKIRRKAVLVAVMLTVVLGATTATKIFNRGAEDLEGSSESRKSFWISGLRMALHNPVFGVGYEQFPANFEGYATEIVGEWGKRTAHSSWILAIAEGGPIGFLLFFGMYFFGCIQPGYRLFRHDPTWIYAAMSYGTAMTFLSHTYTFFPYILTAATTVTAQAYLKDLEKEKLKEKAVAA